MNPGRGRRLQGRISARFRFLAVCLFLAGTAAGQTGEEESAALPPPPTIFDLSFEVADPSELHPKKGFQNNWRRIWGALGMRAHYYPSQLTGPENWPPHLYSGGMNYSVWRNTVTGWSEATFP